MGGNWRTSAVSQATTGEIEVVLAEMSEAPSGPSVQLERGYQRALSRAHLSDVDDDSVTIPLRVVRPRAATA